MRTGRYTGEKLDSGSRTLGDTIRFSYPSMMFAFAGLEVAPMIAGRTVIPQRDFPRAMAVSAAVIVGICYGRYWALNTRLPAGKPWRKASCRYACCCGHAMPWLIPVIWPSVCFWRSPGKLTRLVGPIYMLEEASREDNLLGDRIGKLHPVWKTPAFA